MAFPFHIASTSSNPIAQPRPRIQLGSSRIVRKARESRYLGGGGGGDSELGSESLFVNSPRLSTTMSESEEDFASEESGEWYKTRYPTNSLKVQKYARDMPYFLSYGNPSLDWDSTLTSMLEKSVAYSPANARVDSEGNPISRPPPRKVLDVGCGAGYWMLNQALVPGWEETYFVGLDAEPTKIRDDLLPPDLAGRISHVQHDLLKEPLPFLDNQFDFVRIARMNLAIPEIKWLDVLEECIRVLSPGCYIEVVEVDFALTRGNELVQKLLDSVLEHQFINPRPLTVIPSNLTLAARDLRSTGRLTARLPSSPHSPDDIPLASEPTLSTNLPSLGKFAAGSDPILINSTLTSRLALHQYAEWLDSSSWGIANAALKARESGRKPSEHDESSQGGDDLSTNREKELGDSMNSIETWAEDLRERAGLAQIITSRLGWQPTFDRKLQEKLEANLPTFEDRLRTFGRERRQRASMFAGQQDPEIEFRYQQAELAKRECEHELKQVRRRLEGRERMEDEDDLGSIDIEVFVARAP